MVEKIIARTAQTIIDSNLELLESLKKANKPK